MKAAYPEWDMYDETEQDRLEHLEILKAKGKGAPKKKTTAAGKYNDLRELLHSIFCMLTVMCDLQKAGRSLGRSGSLLSC